MRNLLKLLFRFSFNEHFSALTVVIFFPCLTELDGTYYNIFSYMLYRLHLKLLIRLLYVSEGRSQTFNRGLGGCCTRSEISCSKISSGLCFRIIQHITNYYGKWISTLKTSCVVLSFLWESCMLSPSSFLTIYYFILAQHFSF